MIAYVQRAPTASVERAGRRRRRPRAPRCSTLIIDREGATADAIGRAALDERDVGATRPVSDAGERPSRARRPRRSARPRRRATPRRATNTRSRRRRRRARSIRRGDEAAEHQADAGAPPRGPRSRSPPRRTSCRRGRPRRRSPPRREHHDRPGDEHVISARERRTTLSPSCRSRQWPRPIGARSAAAARGSRERATPTARTSPRSPSRPGRGPRPRRSRRRSAGPRAVVVHSTTWSSAFALAAPSLTRFGRPASTAGPEEAVRDAGDGREEDDERRRAGERERPKTPRRTRSEPIISPRRESQSTSGPSSRPRRPPAGCSRRAARRPTSPSPSGRRRRPGARSPPASCRGPSRRLQGRAAGNYRFRAGSNGQEAAPSTSKPYHNRRCDFDIV